MCNNYYFHKLWRGPRKSIIRSSGGPVSEHVWVELGRVLVVWCVWGLWRSHVPGNGPCVPDALGAPLRRTQVEPPNPSCRKCLHPTVGGGTRRRHALILGGKRRRSRGHPRVRSPVRGVR